MMRGMVIDMNDEQLDTLARLQAFLDGTAAVDFAVAGRRALQLSPCSTYPGRRRPPRLLAGSHRRVEGTNGATEG